MGAAASGHVWGSCRFCGTAVAPGATVCGLCGADAPVPAAALASAPTPVRRRIAFTNGLRALVVAGVAVALAVTLVEAAMSGPPSVADPLTSSGTYTVAPGSVPFLVGEVTGGDYVVGNFTTLSPAGAAVTISAYNTTEWSDLLLNGSGSAAWSSPTEANGRIIFTALVTDTFVFVLTNPAPASSHLNVTVYVGTQYESNVGDDGFG